MRRASRTRMAYLLSTAVHVVVLLLALGVFRPPPRMPATPPLKVHLLTVPAGENPPRGLGRKDALTTGSMLTAVPARVLARPVGAEPEPSPRPAAVAARWARATVAVGTHPEPLTRASEESTPLAVVPEMAALGTASTPPGGVPGPGVAWSLGPGTAGPGGPGGPGEGGGSQLGELHRRLAEAAVRCYPAAAGRLRLRGVVPVRFCLDARGSTSALSLVGTSGSELLDRSALECVVPGAEPLPPLPGCFEVLVRFGG